MAIRKISAHDFGSIGATSGVTLEYAGKDDKSTAMLFTGEEFTVTANTQDEILRVVKNVMFAHWLVKAKETELRQDNDGIRSKLRATTPYKIHIVNADGVTVKVYDLANSEWARIGLMPTKKDMERSVRDIKSYVHKAAVATLEALKFRVEFPSAKEESEKNKTSKTEKKKAGKGVREILDKVAAEVAETEIATVPETVNAEAELVEAAA